MSPIDIPTLGPEVALEQRIRELGFSKSRHGAISFNFNGSTVIEHLEIAHFLGVIPTMINLTPAYLEDGHQAVANVSVLNPPSAVAMVIGLRDTSGVGIVREKQLYWMVAA